MWIAVLQKGCKSIQKIVSSSICPVLFRNFYKIFLVKIENVILESLNVLSECLFFMSIAELQEVYKFVKKYFMILATTILFINIIEINDNLISHSVDLVDKLDMHSFLPIDNFGSHAWWEQNLRPRRLRNHFFFQEKKYSNY